MILPYLKKESTEEIVMRNVVLNTQAKKSEATLTNSYKYEGRNNLFDRKRSSTSEYGAIPEKVLSILDKPSMKDICSYPQVLSI